MKKTAVNLTMASTVLCMLILFSLCIAAPFLTGLYAELRALSASSQKAILWAFYLSAVPAAASLTCLLKLLINIRLDQPFLLENSMLMAVISWSCVLISAVCCIFGIWYMPLWFITAMMLFLFLIIRVVRGCFISAFYLKEENSLTI